MIVDELVIYFTAKVFEVFAVRHIPIVIDGDVGGHGWTDITEFY